MTSSTEALVSYRDASSYLVPRTLVDRIPPVLVVAGAVAGLCGLAIALSALPAMFAVTLSFAILLAVTGASSRAIADEPIDPEVVGDGDVRLAYLRVLGAHVELAHALGPVGTRSDAILLEQSRDLVLACGRAALATNGAHRHLAAHDPVAIAAEAATLREQAATADHGAAADLEAAALAHAQHVDALVALRATIDRTRARLERARSSIELLAARLVRLSSPDVEEPREQLELQSAAIADSP